MAYMDIGNLYNKYGLEQVVPMAGGEIANTGDTREIDFKITLTDLAASSAIVTGTDNLVFPAGFRVEEVEVICETAVTSGGAATLNLGLVRASDRTTEIDVDGILAVAPITDWNAVGETKTYRVGVTGIGALAGVTSGSYPGHFVADYDTAAFTAGVITVRVRFRKV